MRSISILDQLTVHHGPDDLIAPLFLRIEYAVRQLGLQMSFIDLARLRRVNEANRDSWLPLFPLYHPTYWPNDSGEAFCIAATEESGRTIATLAVRHYAWPGTTLEKEARSLRMYYSDAERFRGPSESCEVSAETAKTITGQVGMAGAVWVHPAWRKHPTLMVLLPRFARAYALTKYNIDYYTLMMTEGVFKGGLTKKTGMANVDWSIDMYGSPLGDLRLALLTMNRTELLEDLTNCLVQLDSEIDGLILPQRSEQDPLIR